MKTQDLHVEEGKSVRFEHEYMKPYSEYFVGKIIEYKILELPKHGTVRSGKSSKVIK